MFIFVRSVRVPLPPSPPLRAQSTRRHCKARCALLHFIDSDGKRGNKNKPSQEFIHETFGTHYKQKQSAKPGGYNGLRSVCCVLVCGQAVVPVNHAAWTTVSDRGHLQKETTLLRIRNRNGPRWAACAAAWGYPLGNGGGGVGRKYSSGAHVGRIMRQYHPTMCPYRAALFVSRPHHARTTPAPRHTAAIKPLSSTAAVS